MPIVTLPFPQPLVNGNVADANQVTADLLAIASGVNENAAANGINTDITELIAAIFTGDGTTGWAYDATGINYISGGTKVLRFDFDIATGLATLTFFKGGTTPSAAITFNAATGQLGVNVDGGETIGLGVAGTPVAVVAAGGVAVTGNVIATGEIGGATAVITGLATVNSLIVTTTAAANALAVTTGITTETLLASTKIVAPLYNVGTSLT